MLDFLNVRTSCIIVVEFEKNKCYSILLVQISKLYSVSSGLWVSSSVGGPSLPVYNPCGSNISSVTGANGKCYWVPDLS